MVRFQGVRLNSSCQPSRSQTLRTTSIWKPVSSACSSMNSNG